ncbi:unnamed protein product [Miscanthus lutarioriparius]|uniref:Uncharacterized protein n=1 Tax=Miscanthus lutarioriparius TaxID=422564 RepID=A0A811QJH0_9POAL|nr:unnamed protein product [Miscanthus lutarioriparius]
MASSGSGVTAARAAVARNDLTEARDGAARLRNFLLQLDDQRAARLRNFLLQLDDQRSAEARLAPVTARDQRSSSADQASALRPSPSGSTPASAPCVRALLC